MTGNLSIRIYINKIKNRTTFKISYLKLLTPETMKLRGTTKLKITKKGNGENVPNLEITDVVLAHCNASNDNYQENLRFFYTFVPNKPLGKLLHISPKSLIFLKHFDSEFSYIKLWFTDQSSKPLEI